MERMLIEAHWGYYAFVLGAGVVVEKGKLAVFDTAAGGALVSAKAAAGLFNIGIFTESLTGDGVKRVQVKLHRELQATWWDNDTVAPVLLTDRGKLAYLKDATTVTMTGGAAASVAGPILDVQTAKGVLVHFPMHGVGPAVVEDPPALLGAETGRAGRGR
jgi:hypothetical protein